MFWIANFRNLHIAGRSLVDFDHQIFTKWKALWRNSWNKSVYIDMLYQVIWTRGLNRGTKFFFLFKNITFWKWTQKLHVLNEIFIPSNSPLVSQLSYFTAFSYNMVGTYFHQFGGMATSCFLQSFFNYFVTYWKISNWEITINTKNSSFCSRGELYQVNSTNYKIVHYM